MLGIFSRYEEAISGHCAKKSRLTAKIVGSILNLFIHLVSTSQGRRQFCASDGVDVLRKFCERLAKANDGDRRWDRLLCRFYSPLTNWPP